MITTVRQADHNILHSKEVLNNFECGTILYDLF